jgi:hypothetical protein
MAFEHRAEKCARFSAATMLSLFDSPAISSFQVVPPESAPL